MKAQTFICYGIPVILFGCGLIVLGHLAWNAVAPAPVTEGVSWSISTLQGKKRVLIISNVGASQIGSSVLISGGWASNNFNLALYSFPLRNSRYRMPIQELHFVVPDTVDPGAVSVTVSSADGKPVLVPRG